MSNRTIALWALVLASVWGGVSVARAAEAPAVPAAVTLGAGSTVWLEGTSNLHEFSSRTGVLELAVTRDPSAADATDLKSLAALVQSAGVRGLDLDVPVLTLKSGKQGLDKNLYKALKTEANPRIHFHLEHYIVTPRGAASDTLAVSADGQLRIAGAERPVTLTANLVRSDHGMWLEGSTVLKMTQYGVRPPTMMLGALRVNDPVTVRYRLLLAPAKSLAAPGAAATGKD